MATPSELHDGAGHRWKRREPGRRMWSTPSRMALMGSFPSAHWYTAWETCSMARPTKAARRSMARCSRWLLRSRCQFARDAVLSRAFYLPSKAGTLARLNQTATSEDPVIIDTLVPEVMPVIGAARASPYPGTPSISLRSNAFDSPRAATVWSLARATSFR